MITVYINQEHCTSLEQLRGYFEDSPSYGNDLFYDLLENARSGDMSKWLREKGESSLADKMDSIDGDLGDSEYFSCLSALMKGNEAIHVGYEKPDFSKCFTIEKAWYEATGTSLKVFVSLKVLQTLNENYELKVETEWGAHAKYVNPFESRTDEIIRCEFEFRKRPNSELNAFTFYADCKRFFTRNITLAPAKITENVAEDNATIKEILESGDSEAFIRYLENNGTPQWITSLLMLYQKREDNSSPLREERHTETYCNTDNRTKPSEKRYSWDTDSFRRKIENDKRQREEKLKEKERQRQERLEEEERERLRERYRQKHGSK